MSVKKTSAEKRHDQSEVRRMRNKAVKSRCHTTVRKYLDAIQKKDQALASECLRKVSSEYDNAFRKGVIKRNTAARKKSRMAKLFNVTFAAESAAK